MSNRRRCSPGCHPAGAGCSRHQPLRPQPCRRHPRPASLCRRRAPTGPGAPASLPLQRHSRKWRSTKNKKARGVPERKSCGCTLSNPGCRSPYIFWESSDSWLMSRRVCRWIQRAGGIPAARMLARPCVRVAIVSRPPGPWYTAYMAAMLASSAYAAQTIIDLGCIAYLLPRRMCSVSFSIPLDLHSLLCAAPDHNNTSVLQLLCPGPCKITAAQRKLACAPARYRCCWWPCRAGCAAPASASPYAALAGQPRPG